MRITRHNPFTGKMITLEVPVTPEQLKLWESGVPAHEALSHLHDGQRWFIMTGITPEQYARIKEEPAEYLPGNSPDDWSFEGTKRDPGEE